MLLDLCGNLCYHLIQYQSYHLGGGADALRAADNILYCFEEKNMEKKQAKTRKRSRLTGERKFEIFIDTLQRPENKAEILRHEGLYSSDLSRFGHIIREGAIDALKRSRPGRKKKNYNIDVEQYNRLKNELAQKEKALADLTVEFMIIKKNVNGD